MTRSKRVVLLLSLGLLACQGDIGGSNNQDGSVSTDAPVIGSGQLSLDWIDNSDNEDGFVIERRAETGGSFAELARVAVDATHFDDSSIDLGDRYCYRVAAYNGAGQSAFTPEGCGAGRAP